MRKSSPEYAGLKRDSIRALRHSIQKCRYQVRTRTYLSMTIAAALGMVIGYVLTSGSKSHLNDR